MEVKRCDWHMSINAKGVIYVDKGRVTSKGSVVRACSVVSSSLLPPRTVAHCPPLSMGFLSCSRQEYWSGLHFLLQEIFMTQGLNPCLLHWLADSLPLCHLETPLVKIISAKHRNFGKFWACSLSQKGWEQLAHHFVLLTTTRWVKPKIKASA